MTDDAPSTHAALPRHLVEGYEAFLSSRFPREQQRFRELALKGQRPKTLVIGCCDSRVAPEAIFDAEPGELFVLRNVANLVPPYQPDGHYHGASAALEYAVMALEVQHIVVLGHAQCGGVRAFAENAAHPDRPPLSPGDFIGEWIKMIAPAYERIGLPARPDDPAYLQRLEFESIKQALRHLRDFPMIRDRELRGEIELHGAYFGVMDGRLLALDKARDEFTPVAERLHLAAARRGADA